MLNASGPSHRGHRTANLAAIVGLLSVVWVRPAQAGESGAASTELSIGGGLVSAGQVDRGYSPTVFSGLQAVGEIGLHRVRERRESFYRLGVSTGALHNRHGRRLDSSSLSFLVVNLYRIGTDSPLSLGWSNHNQFNSRTIDDFLNFTGRSDYFTSFGPAAQVATRFEVLGQRFSFDATGHVQLLGFYLPSGYISSLPRGFGYEPGGFMRSVTSSSFLFYPGSAVSLGLRPELRWHWRETNSLVVAYNYDFVALRHVHPSRRSFGSYLISLRMVL